MYSGERLLEECEVKPELFDAGPFTFTIDDMVNDGESVCDYDNAVIQVVGTDEWPCAD